MAVDENFCFLTMEEFSRLGRREKSIYLERASEKIRDMTGEVAAGLSLFKDGPISPLIPEPLQKKA